MGILNQMQVLDQKIAPARAFTQKIAHLAMSLIVELAALRRPAALAFA